MFQPQRGLKAQIRRARFPWQCYGNQVLPLTAAQGGISMLHAALVPNKQQTHKQNCTKPVNASSEHGFSFSLYALPATPGEERTSKPKSTKIRACYTPVSPPPSGPLRIVLEVQISLISCRIFDLLLCGLLNAVWELSGCTAKSGDAKG